MPQFKHKLIVFLLNIWLFPLASHCACWLSIPLLPDKKFYTTGFLAPLPYREAWFLKDSLSYMVTPQLDEGFVKQFQINRSLNPAQEEKWRVKPVHDIYGTLGGGTGGYVTWILSCGEINGYSYKIELVICANGLCGLVHVLAPGGQDVNYLIDFCQDANYEKLCHLIQMLLLQLRVCKEIALTYRHRLS